MSGLISENMSLISWIVIVLTLALLAFTVWKEIRAFFDPKAKIDKIDHLLGGPYCSRLVQNLNALNRYYANRHETANYAEQEIYRTAMNQVEEDAMHIVSGPRRVQRMFFHILQKMDYDVVVYENDEFDDPISFEIGNQMYTVKCSYG